MGPNLVNTFLQPVFRVDTLVHAIEGSCSIDPQNVEPHLHSMPSRWRPCHDARRVVSRFHLPNATRMEGSLRFHGQVPAKAASEMDVAIRSVRPNRAAVLAANQSFRFRTLQSCTIKPSTLELIPASINASPKLRFTMERSGSHHPYPQKR